MSIKEFVTNLMNKQKKLTIGTIISTLITFLFAIYNLYLGINFSDSWGYSIGIYYLCLTLAKSVVLLIEYKIDKQDINTTENIQYKTYILLSIFMFFIDLCLVVPITLMILYPKDVDFGLIPAITMAVYTTYKVTIAIINYSKVNKIGNVMLKFIRELSIVDAFVSILTLQHTLIMTNGGLTNKMLIVSAISSFIILTGIVIFSIVEMKKTIKK